MEPFNENVTLLFLGALSAAAVTPRISQRLALSRAKHRSLAGHSKWSKRIAKLLPYYDYDEERFFNSDGVQQHIAAKRRAGFFQLADKLQSLAPKTLALGTMTESGLSDLQFTSRYRVPFQYSSLVKKHLKVGYYLEGSQGVKLKDMDGNEFFDCTGSYGVNVLGYDFYRECLQAAHDRANSLGPVLGSYHPSLYDNIERLKTISGMDEVSFHMSGTEAVMQAVRLARYNTGKRYTVRFCGAYHGWWGDVQPGIGNPATAHDTLTLSEMSEKTLTVLRSRNDISCVLINPLQALHPNQNAPGDSSLVNSKRRAGYNKHAYTQWLEQLREVCTAKGIALIFDEVFVGFRLAVGGAQAYFGVQADMVTYGKTLGGGMPVGVLCGKAHLMKRFRDDKPADICFARGTFNSHPYVVAAMNEFLQRIEKPEIQTLYENLDQRWDAHAKAFNKAFESKGYPVRVANMSSIWTVYYTQPSRYNWMLQYYLRAHGIALSWVGTGRVVFSLNYTDEEVEQVLQGFLNACDSMKKDGWWETIELTDKGIQKVIMKEVISTKLKALFN